MVNHAQALEFIARSHGHRDWNTAHAMAGDADESPPVSVGDRVRGHYLGKMFAGKVMGVHSLGSSRRWRIVLHLAEQVDVSRFESFSALKTRIRATVDAAGRTAARTSDGQPHLELDL